MSTTKINWRNNAIGIFGLLLVIIGNLISVPVTQKILYLFGSIFLLTSSSLEKNKFFVLLQIVVLAGTLIAFAPVGDGIKAGVPIVLTAIIMVYFAIAGELKNRITILGCLGLLFLAAGYAILNPIVYFLGGAFLTAYSFIVYRQGVQIGLLFAVLNFIFTITSMVSIYHHYFASN